MSDNPSRIAPPRGAPRVALPQLKRLLAERGKTQSWLMGELGLTSQAWDTNRKAGGWPESDVPRIARVLGVRVEQLTVKGVPAPDSSATVRELLSRPEVASVTQQAIQSVTASMEAAFAKSMEAAVAALASGRVALPPPKPDPKVRPLRVEADAHGRGPRPVAKRGR